MVKLASELVRKHGVWRTLEHKGSSVKSGANNYKINNAISEFEFKIMQIKLMVSQR